MVCVMKRCAVVAAMAGLVVAGAAGVASGQDLGVRAPAQSKAVAIINAKVHTVSGPVHENGFVFFDGGVIKGLGSGPLPRLEREVEVIDAKGQHVYPGMIAAYTQTGLTEIAAVRATLDFNETGAVSPEVFGAVAVNPDSTIIPVTRKNGVLATGVFPTGGTVPGRASVIRLEGWTWEDLAVKKDAGLVVAWPFMRTVTAWWQTRSEEDQRTEINQSLNRLKDVFRTAEVYLAEKDGPRGADKPTDVRWEAMRGVLGKGRSVQGRDTALESRATGSGATGGGAGGGERLPVFIEAQDFDQIAAAVAFGVERGLKVVIVGGRDAGMLVPLLKQHDVAVIVNSVLTTPKRDDSGYDEVYSVPAKLFAGGVRFCISSGEETPHERNLPYAAGMAVAHGLPAEAALRAVTLSAAEILGVGEVLGSLDVGKEATLFMSDGDPLEATTQVNRVFIQGKTVDLSSKQSELAEKYREKYRQMGQWKPAK